MSFGGSFDAIVKRYGRAVSVERDGIVLGTGRALLQPMLDQEAQFLPSELGVGRDERTLCLGERSLPLDPAPGETLLRQGDEVFVVVNARAVDVGTQRVYWRAVLKRREEAAG